MDCGISSIEEIKYAKELGKRAFEAIVVATVIEVGKEYLLLEEDFVLSPHYIFVTFPTFFYSFFSKNV